MTSKKEIRAAENLVALKQQELEEAIFDRETKLGLRQAEKIRSSYWAKTAGVMLLGFASYFGCGAIDNLITENIGNQICEPLYPIMTGSLGLYFLVRWYSRP